MAKIKYLMCQTGLYFMSNLMEDQRFDIKAWKIDSGTDILVVRDDLLEVRIKDIRNIILIVGEETIENVLSQVDQSKLKTMWK